MSPIGTIRAVRGRGLGPGLACLALAASCTPDPPGPPATQLDGRQEPARRSDGGADRVESPGPRERLIVYEGPATKDATLLFLEGRAATPLPGGRSAWADRDGARLLVFEAGGAVSAVLGGAPPDGPPLVSPAFVAADRDRLLAVEADGQALAFRDGRADGWLPVTPAAAFTGTGKLRAGTRTVFDIALRPLAAGDPLLWIERDGETRPIDEIKLPEQAMLAPVANAGWVATDGRAAVYWASAVRPELRRYSARGTLEWIATWPNDAAYEPRWGVDEGTLTPVFRLIHQAVAMGPDGLVYLLATTGGEGPADRLLVFSPDGEWLRAGNVEPWDALYVGPRGHVFALPADKALTIAPEGAKRVAFEPFELPDLEGEGTVRLADYEGKVVVVNFWASWCVPCRREMPLLDAFARELDPARAAVIGLNEDTSPRAGVDFARRLGGVSYPMAAGRGQLRERYGYRGLPYTVVLSREHEVLEVFFGFGSSIEPIKDAVEEALRGPTGEPGSTTRRND